MHGSSDTGHEGSWWCERLEGQVEADDWLLATNGRNDPKETKKNQQ